MSKQSVFTIFFSAVVIMVVAEFLANPSLNTVKTNDDLGANVVANENPIGNGNEVAAGETPDNNNVLTDSTKIDSVVSAGSHTTEQKISFGLLTQAGFSNVTLQRVPFDGTIFGEIKLIDSYSNTVSTENSSRLGGVIVIANNLLQNNQNKIAHFNEVTLNNSLAAQEIYDLIKAEALTLVNAKVNESNQFGDKSFYINFDVPNENAFLVVKTGRSVYTFAYLRELHLMVKKLISLLYKLS